MSVQYSTTAGDAVLYVGALFDYPESRGCKTPLPGLQRFVARAGRQTVPVQDSASFVNWVAAIDGSPMPVAAICRYGESGNTDEHCWLLADPVHLEPTQDTLRLFAVPLPDVGQDNDGLAGMVRAHVAQDGWVLEVSESGRWYLGAPAELRCETTSTERVEGADVFPFMPTGEHGKRLRSLMNDVQMLAHQHAGSAAARVNSIWPWGQGCWRATPAAPGESLAPAFARHPYLIGLWRHWGVQCAGLDNALSAIETGGGMVAMPELAGGDKGLLALEQRWLSPLLECLSAGRVDSVWLVLHGGQGLRLSRRELRRVWRRPRALTETLSALSGRAA